MHLYLAPYVGDGTDLDPFRPRGTDGAGTWSAIDLRGDGSQASGWSLLRLEVRAADESGMIYLGGLDDVPDVQMTWKIERELGLDRDVLAGLSWRQIITDLLIVHADDIDQSRGRWKKLFPSGDKYRIWLGELIFEQPVVAGGATITETWPTNGTTISSGQDLTWTEVALDVEVVSGRLRLTGDGYHRARAESDLDGTDHYAESQAWSNENEGAWHLAGVCVRYAPSADTCYAGIITDSSSSSRQATRIFKVVNGSITVLSDTASRGQGWWTDGDVVRLTVDGSDLTLEGPVGTTLETVTDTSITTGTRCGHILYTNNSPTTLPDQEVDNFEAADLAGGPATQTISVGTVTETETAQGVTPTPGSVSVAVGAVTEIETAQPVTATPGATTVAVGAVSEIETARAVTVTPGSVTIVVGGVSETEVARSIGASTTGGTQTISVGIVSEIETARSIGASTTGFGVPTGLTATAVSQTQIDLSWNAVTGATSYDVERDSVVIATGVVTESYSDTGLSPASGHEYRVRASR